jgi:DNA-binding transcriptional ArsR family regulator
MQYGRGMTRPLRQRDAFTAIAEPTRRSILGLLEPEPLPVSVLAGRLHLSQPTVSEHLRTLSESDLVNGSKIGREHHFSLRPEGLAPVAQWICAYGYWMTKLDALGMLLVEDR